MGGMSRIVRDAIDRYERRMPGARAAANTDPIQHHLTTWMHRMLDLVDMVLEDEGIPEETRRKVAQCILYGSPNQADAEMRQHQNEMLAEHLRNRAPSIVLEMPEGWQAPEGWNQ